MKIWIDNTGIHGAGRCVEGRAISEIDLHGFLQFAILLAFSEKLQFNPFEPDHVVSRTQEFISRFRSAGVTVEILERSDETEESYALACLEAAKLATEDLPEVYLPGQHDTLGLAPELPRGMLL